MISTYFEIRCVCGYEDLSKTQKNLIQCPECHFWQHKDCLKTMSIMRNYLCPHCQTIKNGLFYNILYTLLEPSIFEIQTNKKNSCSYTFIPDIFIYPKLKNNINNVQNNIIIRCLRFDKDGFYFHWPKKSKIFLNGKLILDLTIKGSKIKNRMIAFMTKKDFEDQNKKHFLYDANILIIEDFIFDQRPNKLEIEVDYLGDEILENTNFAISIDCCEILKEPSEIIKKIPCYKEKTKLKEILKKNMEEDEISSGKEKISLMDIFTESEKIKLPGRGMNCCHLNVFDIEKFLVLNRKTNKYQCPYCKRYANDLYIDGIILDFIENKNNFDVEEILIDNEYNILSYVHRNSNTFFDNGKILYIDIKNNQQESFNPNKNFKVSLNGIFSGNNNNFSSNNKFNVVTDLGQIFDSIKKEIISEKNNYSEVTCLNKSPIKKYYKFHESGIEKYQHLFFKELDISDEINDQKDIKKVYDTIQNQEDLNDKSEILVPISMLESEKDESTDQSCEQDSEICFMRKRERDRYFGNTLNKSLFEDFIKNDTGKFNNGNNIDNNI